MQNYWDTIPGWFNFNSMYDEALNTFSHGSTFVEIGTWKGKSAAYMAERIKDSGKNIKFDCVDTWLGSEEHVEDIDVVAGTLFETFVANMKPLVGFYNPIRLTSIEAAKLYSDCSLQFVYIDASHDYDNVIQDITAWKSKIANGGILAGHDIDYPTVKQAVDELLPGYKVNHCSWIYYM